jgi:hypothetical protein
MAIDIVMDAKVPTALDPDRATEYALKAIILAMLETRIGTPVNFCLSPDHRKW